MPRAAVQRASLPEVCGDAPFYFEPNLPESLPEALRQAVRDGPARESAIERGRLVASRFTWEKCAGQTLALYRECLGD